MTAEQPPIEEQPGPGDGHAAAAELAMQLEEWKSAGAHVSSVMIELRIYIEHIVRTERDLWLRQAMRRTLVDAPPRLMADDPEEPLQKTITGELVRIRATLANLASWGNHKHAFDVGLQAQAALGAIETLLITAADLGISTDPWPPGVDSSGSRP